MFQDEQGREWNLSIVHETTEKLRKLRATVVIDDKGSTESKPFAIDEIESFVPALLQCAPILFDVLWTICSDQAQRQGVSQREFKNNLRGEVLEAATDDLWKEIIDFFPKPRAEQFRKILEGVQGQLASVIEQQVSTIGRQSTELRAV